ncbi:hypothetical protein [Algoriphagus sp.]|uniref:hypothetical protein n=1 Tax=Algoriphagus sp. TaxID=1872435 RepID=UPI00391B606A
MITNKRYNGIWLPLIFFLFGCEEEPIPVIPDPTAQPPITRLPDGVYFTLKVSDVLLCPEEEISISVDAGDNKPIDLKELNFYFSPDIGSLDLTSGKYKAPFQNLKRCGKNPSGPAPRM